MSMEEILAEIVKNAVHEALTDVRVRLDAIEEKVKEIKSDLTGLDNLATDSDMRELEQGVYATLDEITETIKREELNSQRIELWQRRAS